MRNYAEELNKRVGFIRDLLEKSGARGIVFGNSGGKDCTLVGILCKKACPNTLGVILPCGSKRNFSEDLIDAVTTANQFDISTKKLDLTPLRKLFEDILGNDIDLTPAAATNIPPRLRMTALYAIAGSENRLVAGTGNRSESHMGYFTKWGDGAYDFNPISDLTVTEIYEFLEYLNVPRGIIDKAPSAGLFDGQTDEGEMGISYAKIDDYILNGNASLEDKELIDRFHKLNEHKRKMPLVYEDN